MKLYFIRNKKTKKLLGVSTFKNEGEFCNDVGANFELNSFEVPYCVSQKELALAALKSDPKWYNSSVTRPQWPTGFNPDLFEVFEIDVDLDNSVS